MPKTSPEIEAFARIKVVGVGGSGTNALDHMILEKVKGVEFIAMNTDAQALHHSAATKKIHMGKNLTRGLGTGMNPELGRKAAEETLEEIQSILKGADMIFVACGMGGGTGTGASSAIAKIAKDQGALTVAVVTRPFFFEGAQRAYIADQGLQTLSKEVDALIVIPNDRLLGMVDNTTSLSDSFAQCDEVLRQAVEGISDLITTPGIINVDFADVKAIMQNAGSALMGIGYAEGEKRAIEAAKQAINSPLLDIDIDGARGVLFAIAGGDDMTMFEVQEAAKIITESIDKDAKVIFGAIRDEKLKKGQLKVTVIASGFPERSIQRALGIGSYTDRRSHNGESASVVDPKADGDLDEEDEGKSFAAELMARAKDAERESSPRRDEAPAARKSDEEESEWSSIPAFLRRSRPK